MSLDYFDNQQESDLETYKEEECKEQQEYDNSLFPDGSYKMQMRPFYSSKKDKETVSPEFYSPASGNLMLRLVLETTEDTANTKKGKIIFHNVWVAPKPGAPSDKVALAARMSKPVFEALIGEDVFLPTKEWVEKCGIEYTTEPKFKVTKKSCMDKVVLVKIETEYSEFQNKEVNVVKRISALKDGDVSSEIVPEKPVAVEEVANQDTPSNDALDQVEDF